eukprot:Amastigsp_a518007_3.p1 type:complete len:106 gc:universal Amastigsp_a518007_3:509-192(-)
MSELDKLKNINTENINKGKQEVFDKIKQLIQETGQHAVVYLNQATNHLYWSIGHHVLLDLKHEVYSSYGKQIIATLSQPLSVKLFSILSRRKQSTTSLISLAKAS